MQDPNNQTTMRLELFQYTDRGDRDYNQDYMAYIIEEDYALLVVADGLGGHHAGEKASQFFCQGMINCAAAYRQQMDEDPVSVFLAWINSAIDEMTVLFSDDPLAYQAHTTCAILYLDKDKSLAAHCGDSRIYRLNPSEIVWRSLDHSVPQDLVNIGIISEDELADHPEQNRLTRSINVNGQHPIDIKMLSPIEANETFVLCTDGFWGHIKPEEMLQLSDLDCNIAEISRLAMLSLYRADGNGDNLSLMSIRHKQFSPDLN